jgi:thiol-disulfide isomerase/thioredoxin
VWQSGGREDELNLIKIAIMRMMNYCVLFFLLAQAAFAQNREGEIYQRDWMTPDSLYKAAPEFLPISGAYQPAGNAAQLLRCYDEPITILIFFGSWCSDSKREVPRFFTTLDLVNNKNFAAKLFGIDRTKKDAAGFAETFKIEKVPTYIFLRGARDFAANGRALNGQTEGELGRITEKPSISLEQDWVNILKHNTKWAQQMEFEQRLVMLGFEIAFLSATR